MCALCGVGKYSTQTGATYCAACAAGTAQTHEGSTSCELCAAGSYADAQLLAYGCMQCARGKMQSATGATSCAPCAQSTYASTLSATRCESCAPGTYTNTQGAISAQQCASCDSGWYIDGGTCVECDVGHYYCPGGGVRIARTLPVIGQTYVQVFGGALTDDYVVQCSQCVLGETWIASACGAYTDTLCADCQTASPPYTYVTAACTLTANTQLAECDAARRAPGGVCNPCPPGTEGDHCALCPPQTFKSTYGSDACVECAPGTLSLGGASRCTTAQCAPGTFAPDGAQCSLSHTDNVPWRDALPATWDARGVVAVGESAFWVVDALAQVWRVDRKSQGAWLAAQTELMAPTRLIALSANTMLLLSADGGLSRLDVAAADVTLTPTRLGVSKLRHPLGMAAMSEWGALIADYAAHCVWALTLSESNLPLVQAWRGVEGEQATEIGGWRLANPSDVAFQPEYDAKRAFVLDARGVWEFDALHVPPMHNAGDLTHACGGGATLLVETEVPVADADLAGSLVVELAVGWAGDGPALFLLSVTSGIWAMALSHPTAVLRPIGGLRTRALAWSGGRLWGLGAEGGITEAGLGAVVVLEPVPEMRCLCDAGLYCDDAVKACVVAPAGTVAPSWSSNARACPQGTLFDARTQTCGACALPAQFTTYTDGAVVCDGRCAANQVFYAGACQAGCGDGEYLVPMEGCAPCPLGTAPLDGLTCQPCELGQYGVSPGVCGPCPSGTTTLFRGADQCMPCGTGTYVSILREDTLGQCLACEYAQNECVTYRCHDSDGLTGACDTTAVQQLESVRGPISVTSTGRTVVWDAEVSDHDDVTLRERFEANGTCVLRGGAVWLGDCGLAGEIDGARSTGTARLGVVTDIALVAVDGVGAVLFVSTMGETCASVRGASLYDGTLSTLVGADSTRMPTLLWTECPSAPFVIAAARGVNELLLASGSEVWRIENVLTRARKERIFSSTPYAVTSMCMRGSLDSMSGMALIVAEARGVWLYGAPSNASLWSNETGVRDVACAGRHVWWIDADGVGWSSGVGETWVEGCMAGFVRTEGHGCARVGVGQLTITGESVAVCPSGTFGEAYGCNACPPGSVSEQGQALCKACPPPLLASGSDCVAQCPSGSQPMPSSRQCVACPAGSGSNSKGAACAPCAVGEYANASTGGVCVSCPDGFTSRAGSLRCVVVCPTGKCAPTGDVCESVTQDWEIVTSVQIEGGSMLTAVAVGEGGSVFYTDGGQLYYFLDNCTLDATVASVLSPCQRSGVPLLPVNPCPSCVRGLTSLAIAGGFESGVRYVYALSYSAHALYRFPIRFRALSSVLVDVDATMALLDAGGSDLSGWILVGGASGMVDGNLSNARFNLPTEMELSRDDRWLYVSDAANQRIRVVDLVLRQVSTLMGDGVPSWRSGPIGCTAAGCAGVNWPSGMGLSPDGKRLYLVQYGMDRVGVVDLIGRLFEPFCQLNWQNSMLYTTESCAVTTGSRSCFLYRPFDVLASPSGRIYVASTNALTYIDSASLACQQVGGAWWAFRQTDGFRDGGVNDAGAPQSLLNRPAKLALDASRGILYMADFSNGALRRAFVDGECRCAQGSILLSEAQACYNPTPPWDVRQKRVADCPSGQFALEGDVDCRDCASEAAFYGAAASACLLWRAQTAAKAQLEATGLSFVRVRSKPELEGASHFSDWFGDPTAAFTSPARWNDIFRLDSPVTYRPGVGEGRVPGGGEFVSLVWRDDVRLWDLAPPPRRMVPGLWYPCYTGFAPSDGCDCSTGAAAFADPNQVDLNDGMVRWHELRLSAVRGGARVLSTSELKAYADGSGEAGEAVRLWSLFLAMGSDVGPTFPAFVHHAVETETFLTQAPTVRLRLETKLAYARCVAGWPAHYECAEGFVWVGPNTTALNASQFVWRPPTAQIACLSCLPGTYSARSVVLAGGPYQCVLCPLGHFASGVATAGACAPCMSGTYASHAGATKCEACPSNHYTHAPGAIQARDCSPCPPGTGVCVDCVPGEWQDLAAQSTCRECAVGTYSDTTNATACVACARGTYQPFTSGEACLECPEPSRFFPDARATACVECSDAACPLVIDGVCGVGCGLNHYWDQTTCRRCPVSRFFCLL